MLSDWPLWCGAVLITAVGTAVQASIGFGAAMIAAPLLLLIDPAFIPGPMIATLLLLSMRVAWQERHAIDYRVVRPAVAGRLLSSLPAALLLGSVSAVTFDLIFSLLVLLAVALSLMRIAVQPSTRTVFCATLLSGFMETLSGIGGPPIALVYQSTRGPELRANLSVLFMIGTAISLVVLFFVGRFGADEVLMTLPLLVGMVIGLQCIGPLRRYLDGRSARPYLLGLCTLAALMVLGRALSTVAG
jgi:uncharacterized membrane protein YfcA